MKCLFQIGSTVLSVFPLSVCHNAFSADMVETRGMSSPGGHYLELWVKIKPHWG